MALARPYPQAMEITHPSEKNCTCGHRASEHKEGPCTAAGCRCQGLRQGPAVKTDAEFNLCACGHADSAHLGGCTVPGCICREMSPAGHDADD